MYYNRNYKTWKQAFAEVNAEITKHEIIRAIASEIVQKPVENLVGFTDEQRNQVWSDYYNTLALNR